MSTTYKIILLGAMPGVTDIQAQAGFGKVFNLPPEQAAPLFKAGRGLKSGLTHPQAAAYISQLETVGVACEMRQEPQPQTPLETDPATAVASPAAEPVDAVKIAEQPTTITKPREVAFVFSGKGFEYFKIWIVNILLTVVTLGIYSAWAKVRNKQYFYGNTYLDDVSFSYTANPVKILIGRIIALVFVIAYSVAGKISLIAGAVMGVLFVVFLPWVVCKSLRFNARYSSYRNVPFAFNGSLWGAACAFVLWPLLGFLLVAILSAPGWFFLDLIYMMVVVPGLLVVVSLALFPLVFYKQKHFIYSNHGYGTTVFRFSATVKSYYLMFLMALVIYVPLSGATFWLTSFDSQLVTLVTASVMGYVAILLAFSFFVVRLANINYNAITLQNHELRANWKVGSYVWLMLSNVLLIVFTLGLFIPWAKVRIARFKAQYTRAVFVGDMDDFAAGEQSKVSALGESLGEFFDIDIGF